MMRPSLYGLVLAGGESLRMGQDKSALIYHGQPQARYLAALLAPYTQRVLVSVRGSQWQASHLQGLEKITDHYAPRSALNGIASSMRVYPHASWLVIAVDMPYVTLSAIELLVAKRDETAYATCFESPAKGGPDPLFAIWEPRCFPALEATLSIDEGKHCPRQALKALGAHVIKNAVPPKVLYNINTPTERDAVMSFAS